MSRSFLWFGVLALVACGPAFVPPAVSPELVDIGRAQWPDTTQESLQRGHDTFVASCGKGGFCHRLRDPHNYPAAELPNILDRMAKKADLNDAQKVDVLRFVLALEKVPPAPKTQP